MNMKVDYSGFHSSVFIKCANAFETHFGFSLLFGSLSSKEPMFNFGGDDAVHYSYLKKEHAEFIKTYLIDQGVSENNFELF